MKESVYVVRKKISPDFWKNKGQALLLGKLDIELTERCNNNCIHCCINIPATDLIAKKKELSSAEIKNIIQQAADLGCRSVRFTGGEPLLRADFEELYIFTRKLGVSVMLFTNATLINKHLVGLFQHIPPGELIEITLYGMKKKTYEAVTRVSGSFKLAMRGIKLLLAHKVPFVVKGALLPANKNEIGEFQAWSKTIPWMDKLPSYSMFFDLRCRKDNHTKDRIVKSLRVSAEDSMKIIARDRGAYFKEMQEFCSKFMRPSGDILFSCGSGKASGCVDAYGFFKPCLTLTAKETSYNLRKGFLKEALEDFFPRVRKIKATNPDYLARCAKCLLKGLCEECPAKSYNEHGVLDAPVEHLCEAAHYQARFLGLLKNNEMGWEIKNRKKRINEFCKRRIKNESSAKS